jgi:hypothetical protein
VALSKRACIELFHIVFLRSLAAKGEDKTLIALKGGCNLRFYYASIRYSEDIDFDVVVIAKETLKKKVDNLLVSPLVTTPLRRHGIEVVETSAPKQTDTTQRWKVGLRVDGTQVPLRTKIEFSRRGEIEGTAFEAMQREVLQPYGLSGVLATHYLTSAAIAQKIHALAGRTEPQARDVFDLDLLLAQPAAKQLELDAAQRARIPDAIERATSISFDEYVAKVVAYLEPSQAEPLADRAAWDAMLDGVVSRLEQIK